MRLTYHGHSCFLLETSQARVLIDPYLNDNPSATIRADDVQCDYLLVSHGHDDHSGDALAIAQRTGATIIANFEIAEYFAAKGAKTHGMNPGGGFNFPFGRVKLTIAHHTSSMESGLHPIYMGVPCGLVISADGKNLYHAGDTALFLDMQLIGRHGLDVAMLPIGDNFTMGPDDALEAIGMLKPKLTIPMHYNTWPVIAQDPQDFARRADLKNHKVAPLQPGESIEI